MSLAIPYGPISSSSPSKAAVTSYMMRWRIFHELEAELERVPILFKSRIAKECNDILELRLVVNSESTLCLVRAKNTTCFAIHQCINYLLSIVGMCAHPTSDGFESMELWEKYQAR